MKYTLTFLICFVFSSFYAQLPNGFIYAEDVIPDLEVELRYFTSNNFVGQPIEGYHSNKLILTLESAQALKLVHEALQEQNLCLKVYDGYRPQSAVNHFIKWARDLDDTINKHTFYPDVKKRNLFKDEYIASKSGHSRGSTLDLTIIDGNTGIPLDMGSAYDFFGIQSHPLYQNISKKQKQNRMLLREIMLNNGFMPYENEWWHFTLKKEPFPNTYFKFPISKN